VLKAIATGSDSFRKIREGNFYYIDKSLFIRDFLDYRKEVSLITRPRRFGKTLGMTMLRDFFDITQESASIFEGLAIMDTDYGSRLNSTPVIFLTLKGCKGSTYKKMQKSVGKQMFKEYDRYHQILKSSSFDESLSAYRQFFNIYEMLDASKSGKGKINEDLLEESLAHLMEVLYTFYGIKPIVIIDEYDQPIMTAHQNGYREEMTEFFVAFLGEAFKGNDYLEQAVLTGIQRVAKESIFSQLNNLTIYTTLDSEYATYFGLTDFEVEKALADYNITIKLEAVKTYYDGYLFGGKHHIYNPWSILSFLGRKVLKSYWINTSTNNLIRQLISEGGSEFRESFDCLIKEGEMEVGINMEASFLELDSPATLWGLLVNAGYLTVSDDIDDYFKRVKIPNFEVKKEFINIVSYVTRLSDLHLHSMFKGLAESDMERFLESYQRLTDQYMSFRHIRKEYAPHSFLLGLSASAGGYYEVSSERESGDGFADIIFKSRDIGLRSHIIIEMKQVNGEQNIENALDEALLQIKTKRYDANLIGNILHVGIVHDGKKSYGKYDGPHLRK